MSTPRSQKLKTALDNIPEGTVVLSSWLEKMDISPDLQRRYRHSGWLQAVGSGAMIRVGDRVSWEGVLYALQTNAGLPIHAGGKTALSLQGKAHFLQLGQASVNFVGALDVRLPKWVVGFDVGVRIDYQRTSFLPSNLGLVEIPVRSFSIRASHPGRALMEFLHEAKSPEELIEAREIMDGLNNLRPNQIQPLLQVCRSVKVKRLFVYLAELANHSWVKHLDMSSIDLGSGTRSMVKNGTYISKYDIVMPPEFSNNAKSSL
jgi:hypothetical protein